MDAAPTRRVITSRSEFHDALRRAFEIAASAGAREIWLSDEDFADWPLGERQVVEHLTQWAHSHRRLTLVAHETKRGYEPKRYRARPLRWSRRAEAPGAADPVAPGASPRP